MIRRLLLALGVSWLCASCSDDSVPLDAAPAGDGTGHGETRPDLGALEQSVPGLEAGPPGGLVEVTSFGSNPGALRMYKLVPAGLSGPAPLLLVLHGCQITAASYAQHSGWNDLARARKFLLVHAEQQTGNNSEVCFNWFQPEDAGRGQGEALSLKQMVDRMRADHPVDGKRIFVSGLSAGAAMAVNLLAAYPDLFVGGAINAGIPAGCASSLGQAWGCLEGSDRTAAAWGDLARAAYPGFAGSWPRLVLFQGSQDALVKPSNLQELVEQWTNLHGTDATADAQATVKGHASASYRSSSGSEVVRTYTIQGMGHGLAVDPGSGPEQGGEAGGGFAFAVGLWSSYHAAEFLGL